MLRLTERQLHILLLIIISASICIGCILGWQHGGQSFVKGKFSTLQDVSEGWVATYETTDEDKLRIYKNDNESQKGIITEVINLPNEFVTDDKVSLSHKLPDTQAEKLFLVFDTKGQHVRIIVNKDEIFDNGKGEIDHSYHVVTIPYEYRNGSMIIEIYNNGSKDGYIRFDNIKIGTFNELIGEAFAQNGIFVLFGIILLISGIIILINNVLIKNNRRNTRSRNNNLLLYVGMEAVTAGLTFLFESRLIRFLINWEYIIYFILTCLVVILSIMHLLVFRCLVNKKRILSVVDFAVLFFCITFVSGMVLQWFELLTFDKIYIIEVVLFGICIVIYTILMGNASYDYRQKEGRPVFTANIILIISIIIEMILALTDKKRTHEGAILGVGTFIYFIILLIYGLKKAVHIEEKTEDSGFDEQRIKERAVEQFNPNLLFASFQTLQNLIKNDSKQSIKMIYYISVYVKNNLRAISNQWEIIAFEEELEHIMAYLQLQKVRSSNLGFALECKIKDFKIPRNTVEPIVENAVKYGVAAKNNKGNVVVRSYEREDGYAIQIIDDGVGFDVSHLEKHSSTSLKNILEILEKVCKAQCEIISKEGKGTVVTIVLPILDNDLLD